MQANYGEFEVGDYQKCHLFIFNRNIEGIQFWEKIGWLPRNDLGLVSKEISHFET